MLPVITWEPFPEHEKSRGIRDSYKFDPMSVRADLFIQLFV